MALLEQVATYLATKLQMTVGEQVFFYEMPDEPAVCIGVLESQTSLGSISQIDASMHKLRIYAREANNVKAYELASRCYKALQGDEEAPETADTGFIKLPDESFIYVFLRGEPVWEKIDQQKRKVFVFEAIVTSQKL